jgi:zinc D-Ala-D-Ala dipeptidase
MKFFDSGRAEKSYMFLVLLLFSCNSSTNNCGDYHNPYNLEIVYCIDDYLLQVQKNPDMELVDLEQAINGVVLDIRYAGENNFTNQTIYTLAKAYARRPVAEALIKLQDSLSHHNLGLKIFDAYRPYSASLKFFEVYPDTNFVANPRYGSRHNRGCAVDVTLIDKATGKEIPMPTGFDDFSEKAHPGYMDLPQEAIDNRNFLFTIMAHFGFTHYPTEWWHFDYVNWEVYPLMDIPFEELQ